MAAEPPPPPRIAVTTARLIQRHRRRKGWTQKQLAERLTELGVPLHQTAVNKIEKNNRDLTFSEAIAFAVALDVPVASLALPVLDEGPDFTPMVALTPTTVVDVWEAWDWWSATEPLGDQQNWDALSPYKHFAAVDAALREGHIAQRALLMEQFERGGTEDVAYRRRYAEALVDLAHHVTEMSRHGATTAGLVPPEWMADMVQLNLDFPGREAFEQDQEANR